MLPIQESESAKEPIVKPRRISGKKVTIRQRKLIKAVVQGKTLLEAGRIAGVPGNNNTVKVETHKALQTPNAKAAMLLALDKAGLSEDAIAREIKKGLREGDMGKHDSYLKLAMQARRVIEDDAPKGWDRVNIAFLVMNERTRRGLPEPIDITPEAK